VLRGAGQTLRYARSWKSGSPPALQDVEIERDGLRLPATLATPAVHGGDLPGWIILGGVTRMGRFHPQLVRFAHALAASGTAVIVPEIPEWRDLRLAPAVTVPTVRAAVRELDARAEVRHGRYGLVGFSFGAPQAVIASGRAEVGDRIASVLSFGGYCDLERTLRCQLTGLHEWRGVTHRIDPDPYGRWVLASNYLTAVPGHEDAGDVAAALRTLALASTENRVPAWDPSHDPLKRELRSALPAARRELFDLFAPLTATRLSGCERSEAMALELAGACRRADPLLDPVPQLEAARVPVHLFHGRGDRLVPYTESLRLREELPAGTPASVTVTGLFAHSAGHTPAAITERVREAWIFFRGLQRALGSVR
jgi:pimeloyl-ACP methyl ester carboxylesterase